MFIVYIFLWGLRNLKRRNATLLSRVMGVDVVVENEGEKLRMMIVNREDKR